MAKQRKATMSSRWIGGAPHLPGVDRGWRVTSLRRRSPQNGQAEKPHCRRGATSRPGEQVTDQTHPRSSTLAHSLALPSGHTDGSPAAHRPQGAALQRDPLALSSDAGVPQLVNHRFIRCVRSGEGAATGRHLGRHAVVQINLEPGGSTPGLPIHSRQRSPRSPKVPDIDGFPESPHRIVTREPPVVSFPPAQQWTGVRGEAGERIQDHWAGFRPNSRLNARSSGRLIGRRPAWWCSFGERQGRRTNTISLWWCWRGYRAAWLSNEADLTHGRRWIMADSSDPLGDCCQLTTGPRMDVVS
ncbi:hypothetical protein ACVWWG_000138 [Bradyrhizobium sp. LB7.2]